MEWKTKCVFFWCRLAYRLTVQLALLDHQLLFASPSDNELLYRTRDGDVVKVNVDTHHTTVIVPNQLFVSVVWLWYIVHPCTSFAVMIAALCFSHPGQIPGDQVSGVTWPATRTVCLWSKTGERKNEKKKQQHLSNAPRWWLCNACSVVTMRLSLQIYQHSFLAKYIIYSLVTQ